MKNHVAVSGWVWVLLWLLAAIAIGLFIGLGWALIELSRYDRGPSPAKTTSPVSEGKITRPVSLVPCEEPAVKKKQVKKKKSLQTFVAKAPVVEQKQPDLPPVSSRPPLVVEAEPKTLLDEVDPSLGKTELAFTPFPEKEVEPPKVGRKILVIRQPSSPYYYGGGGGYSYGSPPSVVYGGTPTFVPSQSVIVPTPSVVTPPPSVVAPPTSGGRPPAGNTGGHSPGGVTL